MMTLIPTRLWINRYEEEYFSLLHLREPIEVDMFDVVAARRHNTVYTLAGIGPREPALAQWHYMYSSWYESNPCDPGFHDPDEVYNCCVGEECQHSFYLGRFRPSRYTPTGAP